MSKKANRTEMIKEAVQRLQLLGVDEEEVEKYKKGQELPGSFVNHEEKRICKLILEQEQKDIIAKLEKDGKQLVYYTIIDTGSWPDGCIFERWTFLTVSCYQSDWDMEKEESIENLGCVSAYVYNCEDPDYSEQCEIPFKNVKGFLLNIG